MMTKEMKVLTSKGVWIPCACLLLAGLTSGSELFGRFCCFVVILVLSHVLVAGRTDKLFSVKSFIHYTVTFMFMELIINLMV